MGPLARQFCNLSSGQDCDPHKSERKKLKAPLNSIFYFELILKNRKTFSKLRGFDKAFQNVGLLRPTPILIRVNQNLLCLVDTF
jgi:hypothetical protein